MQSERTSEHVSARCPLRFHNLWRQMIDTLRGQTAGTTHSDTYQQRRYRLFVPSRYRPHHPRPLVMMLHGCTQDPDDFAAGTGMDELAEEQGWFVLYPEQPASANPRRCWNWFRPENQVRGRGEPATLVALVDHLAQSYAIDREQIFVAGLSAGACMAVSLAVSYPERFAAVGVCAGVPYGAARSPFGALAAMRSGASPANLLAARMAAGLSPRPVLPLIVFQGTADEVVAPENSTQLIRQWADLHRLSVPGASAAGAGPLPTSARRVVPRRGHPFREELYRDRHGALVMCRYLVEGMGHSWPGGDPAGTYTDPAGPSASRLMVHFFRHAAKLRSGARRLH